MNSLLGRNLSPPTPKNDMLQLVIKVPIRVRRSVGLHLTQQLAAGTNATAALCFVVDQGATVYDSAVYAVYDSAVADHRSFVLLELCNANMFGCTGVRISSWLQ